MRTYNDIAAMAQQDYDIGLTAHYKPLAGLINERGYKTVIEIGTAYGGNAKYMLDNTEIESLVCIDPYIYYPAMPGFTCQEEYDTLYRYAIERIGYDERCMVFRKSSKAIIERSLLPSRYEQADLIFLDGSHDYEDVKWECENYSKLVKPGGVLCGHDWDIFEGVNKAVIEFAQAAGKEIHTLPGNIWYIEY